MHHSRRLEKKPLTPSTLAENVCEGQPLQLHPDHLHPDKVNHYVFIQHANMASLLPSSSSSKPETLRKLMKRTQSTSGLDPSLCKFSCTVRNKTIT
jgi:hypothetical protein